MLHQSKFIFILLLFSLTSPCFAKDKVVIGVRAHNGVEYAVKRWMPTIDYLQQKIPDYHFELKPVEQIKEMETLVRENKLDFVITQPVAYVDLEILFGVTRLLTLQKKDNVSQFGSVIITRSDTNNIQLLEDVRNKSIAGVTEKGFGGWLIGYAELLKHGIESQDDFTQVSFLGYHNKVIEAVLSGNIDVGIVRTGMLEKLSQQGEIDLNNIRVLNQKSIPSFPYKLSTQLYPEWAFAKTNKIPNNIAKEVALALLSLPKNSHASIKGEYSEWSIPLSYNTVHELMKSLEVGSYARYGKVSLFQFMVQHKNEALLVILLLIALVVNFLDVYRSNKALKIEKCEKEKLVNTLEHLASHDSLTGLPNRRYFREYTADKIALAQRTKEKLAFLYIDLDGFKAINDEISHQAGDFVLMSLGETYSQFIRKNELIARLGGDEFGMLVYGFKSRQELESVAKRLLEHCVQPITIGGVEVKFGMSIGISIYPDQAITLDELISKADEAMYKVKHSSNVTYGFSDS